KGLKTPGEQQGAAEMARSLLPRLGEEPAVALADEMLALAGRANADVLGTVASALCEGRDALPQAKRARFGAALTKLLSKGLEEPRDGPDRGDPGGHDRRRGRRVERAAGTAVGRRGAGDAAPAAEGPGARAVRGRGRVADRPAREKGQRRRPEPAGEDVPGA